MDDACTKSDGHYQLPLSFRNSKVDLPNNRWLAERRLQCLKEKLQKDEKFPTDYIAFMCNLFSKGYATESTGIQASSSWYIFPIIVYTTLTNQTRYRWYLTVAVSFKGEV